MYYVIPNMKCIILDHFFLKFLSFLETFNYDILASIFFEIVICWAIICIWFFRRKLRQFFKKQVHLYLDRRPYQFTIEQKYDDNIIIDRK